MCGIIINSEENSSETSLMSLIHKRQGTHKTLKVCFNLYSSGLPNLTISSNHLSTRKLLILLCLVPGKESLRFLLCEERQITCTHFIPHKHSNLGGHNLTCDAHPCISSPFCFSPRYFFLKGSNCIVFFSAIFSSMCVDLVEYVVLNLMISFSPLEDI